jgi:uncharacterized protein YggE
MKPIALIPIAIALCVTPLATPVLAQADEARGAFAATTLRLSASGEVETLPDMATITLGVETTAASAVDASRANAELMNRVIGALKASGVADRDTQTSQLSLSPQYVYEANHPPHLTGYQASNQVRVAVRDLSKLGRTADAVVGAGATNVGQIEFGLTNPVAAQNSARVAAVKSLEDKASLYAQATGYRIGRLVNITEGGSVRTSPPMPMMALAAKAEAVTPVATGQLTVHIDVTGVFELVK